MTTRYERLQIQEALARPAWTGQPQADAEQDRRMEAERSISEGRYEAFLVEQAIRHAQKNRSTQ